MKHLLATSSLLLFSLFSLWAQTAEDSTAFFNGEWEIIELGKGAQAVRIQAEMFDSYQHIAFVRYPMKKFRTDMAHRPGKEAGKTSVLARDAGARFAINGGYFNGQLEPITFFKTKEGIHCASTYPKGGPRINGALCIKGNGKRIRIKEILLPEHESATRKFHSVITSGPLVMDEGSVSELRDSSRTFVFGRHPRSIFGYDDKGYAYMMVIDGRHKGKAAGVTIPEAAFITRILGLVAAINLDGGGSSALWTDTTGVLNCPCDNKRFDHEGERRIPNIIYAR